MRRSNGIVGKAMHKGNAAIAPRQRMSLEDVTPVMAKAEFNKVENRDFREVIGHAIQRALSIAGLSQKEAAGLVGKEPAQMARWIAGTERPQFDALFAVEQLRSPLVIALAQEMDDSGIQVVTQISLRQRRPA